MTFTPSLLLLHHYHYHTHYDYYYHCYYRYMVAQVQNLVSVATVVAMGFVITVQGMAILQGWQVALTVVACVKGLGG